jgi:hypothetical protein
MATWSNDIPYDSYRIERDTKSGEVRIRATNSNHSDLMISMKTIKRLLEASEEELACILVDPLESNRELAKMILERIHGK